MNVIDVTAATISTIGSLNISDIERVGDMLSRASRVFTVGNGGSAAHASHCACDLTKLARIPTYCLNDNVAAYSAGVNDDGEQRYARMLHRYRFNHGDMLLIFSVGGGSSEKNISLDLVLAAAWAHERSMVAAVVGRRGDVVRECDAFVQIDCPVPELITPVVESVMPLVWHALVAGPLKREEPVWR